MGNVVPLACTCKEASVVQPTAAGAKKKAQWRELAAGEQYAVPLKVALTKKDAAVFMARLEERARRAAAARRARMRMKGLVGAVSPCRDAWRPGLATIPEK